MRDFEAERTRDATKSYFQKLTLGRTIVNREKTIKLSKNKSARKRIDIWAQPVLFEVEGRLHKDMVRNSILDVVIYVLNEVYCHSLVLIWWLGCLEFLEM